MQEQAIRGAVLLLAANIGDLAGYLRAAEKLGVAHATGIAEDAGEPSALQQEALRLRFEQRESALEVVEYSAEHPLAAIVPVDELAAPSAMRAASMMGMRCHAPRGADACLDKFSLRQKLSDAGLRAPLLGDAPPGEDLAVAAIIDSGKMRVLGLAGAALPKLLQQTALENVLRAARVVGLSHGPVTAKLRIVYHPLKPTPGLSGPPDRSGAPNAEVWMLDVAAVVTRDLRERLGFRIPLVDEDVSLEEVVLRHALGLDIRRIYAAPR